MSQQPVLEVRHVTGGYRTPSLFGRGKNNYHEVLHDVDFTVYHGEILGLVGESGTGKSTLARIILGLVKPEQGEVIHHTPRPQIIFQDPYSSLNPAYSVEWSVEEPLRIYGKYDAAERKRRVREMLKKVELPEECFQAKPDELSGGQRQRVAIARALINNPAIVMADEPTGNLDTKSSYEIMEIFKKLNAMGKTIVMVTHEPDIGQQTKRILVMRDGHLNSDERLVHDYVQ